MAQRIAGFSSEEAASPERWCWCTAQAAAWALRQCNWRGRRDWSSWARREPTPALKLVQEQGAQHAVNHAAAGYLDELMKLTGGRGFDLILEMLANKNLASDLGLLAKKGRVVVIGNRGTIEINPRDAMAREADIRGMTLFATSEQEAREMRAALGAGLENGTLRPVIGQRFPLAEAARAHEEIMSHAGALGKMVLVVG